MRTFALFLLAAAGTVLSMAAPAEQGCPPGQIPHGGTNMSTCGPIPGQQQPANPDPAWVPQWQAIAGDAQAAVLGTSRGKKDSAEAQQAALIDCTSKGGSRCKIYFTQGNGCLSMVTGARQIWTDGGATQSQADGGALAKCKGGDSSCQVYYSSCNLPVRVQ
ncbi:DUF4189 domain-containing protein [Luteibacter yeojuensis]|uniref:DUF4189 domain-containing protein n=1 Tax=Luteibacter yeojuensis TaxID=345309 RepID=UPI000A0622DB|nr:DUF4189 domain-containing protein [Luteibacter yeojuensis]